MCDQLLKEKFIWFYFTYVFFPSPRQLISCWYCAWKQWEKMSYWKCASKLAIISVMCALSQCVYFLVIACFLKIPGRKLSTSRWIPYMLSSNGIRVVWMSYFVAFAIISDEHGIGVPKMKSSYIQWDNVVWIL